MKMKNTFRKAKTSLFAVLCLFTVFCSGMFAGCESADDSYVKEETSKGTYERSDLKEEDSLLEIHYIDVGQGDATLIVCDGEAMLVDAGNNSKGTAIQLYLEKQGITSLKYVIGTHPDADHIGGLDVVITKFDCQTVFLTDEEKDTATYRDVLSAMKYKGYEKTIPQAGAEYALGDASFTITAPVEKAADSNDNSIAFVLRHGKNSFYFEGDAGEEEETSILKTGRDVSADMYKIGHHGSKTSTSEEMLEAVNPSYAVISVGEGNRYGHPHAEVLNRLRANGIQVFRTDEQGVITASSDGEKIWFNMQASDSWQTGEGSAADTDEAQETSDINEIQEQNLDTDEKNKQTFDSKTEELTTEKAENQNTDTNEAQEQAADTSETQEQATDTSEAREQNVNTNEAQEQNADTNEAQNQTSDTIVHITETGAKYHRAGCMYLKESDIEIPRSEAEQKGYTPCGKCKP